MGQQAHIVLSFGVKDTPENKELVKQLKVLAAKDGWSLSELLRQATLEYFKNHNPGNPQLGLAHWSEGLPFPRTLEHKHYWRPEQGAGAHWYECDCGQRQS